MIRERLYRGYTNTDGGKWVYGGILVTEDWVNIYTVEDSYTGQYEMPSCDVLEYEVIPETVGEYIGKDDKHGTKIFEDDNVLFGDNVYVVQWDAEECSYCLFIGVRKIWGINKKLASQLEVMGNIHDNPIRSQSWG